MAEIFAREREDANSHSHNRRDFVPGEPACVWKAFLCFGSTLKRTLLTVNKHFFCVGYRELFHVFAYSYFVFAD